MFDASGRAVDFHAAGSTASEPAGPPLPTDVVAALTGLPRRTLRELGVAGVVQPVDGTDESQPHLRGTPATAAAAYALLVALGVDRSVAIPLVRPSTSSDPDVARHAAAVRRLLAGEVSPRALDAELQVLPAAHLVGMRVRVSGGERWTAAARSHSELARFVRMHEMTPCGPVTVSVTDVAEEELGLEVSVPVEELVGSSGPVHPAHRPAMQVAVARHLGDPLTSVATGEALWRWIHEQSLLTSGLPMEIHIAADRVDLCWPVA